MNAPFFRSSSQFLHCHSHSLLLLPMATKRAHPEEDSPSASLPSMKKAKKEKKEEELKDDGTRRLEGLQAARRHAQAFADHAVHPQGIQPLGNLYFSSAKANARADGLGQLGLLNDDLLATLLLSAPAWPSPPLSKSKFSHF